MRYFYEYKMKQGVTTSGHNLEEIEFYDNFIKLLGVDFIPTYDGDDYKHWGILLDMNIIEYLKIEPMEDEEK